MPPGEPTDRAKVLSVRLTSDEFAALAARAQELGVGPSTLARTFIRHSLGAAVNPLTSPGPQGDSPLEARLARDLVARVEALERWVAEH
jgi:hypothetical protein